MLCICLIYAQEGEDSTPVCGALYEPPAPLHDDKLCFTVPGSLQSRDWVNYNYGRCFLTLSIPPRQSFHPPTSTFLRQQKTTTKRLEEKYIGRKANNLSIITSGILLQATWEPASKVRILLFSTFFQRVDLWRRSFKSHLYWLWRAFFLMSLQHPQRSLRH
jgi:hypothetical protein